MAPVEKPAASSRPEGAPRSDDPVCDSEGFPWLENGEGMDQKTFHERYAMMPPGLKAELIEGKVYVIASPVDLRHSRNDAELSGCLFLYGAATVGTMSQNNATMILGEASELRPDSALLIRPEYGGQSRDGQERADFTFGAPELLVEVAFSSRSIDLHAKLRDYERAGVLEYLVYDLTRQALLGFERCDGRFQERCADLDGVWRSRVFPGLWLDTAALARGDRAALVATLQAGLAAPEHAAFVAELERRRASRSESS